MIKIKNSNRGFTLLELLIVVAIIGLLASLILVGLSSFRSRGRDARRIADVKQVQNGLEIYYAKENKYPPITSGVWNDLAGEIKRVDIGITQISQDPLGVERSYVYMPENGTNPQSYVIAVKLEDTSSQSLKNDLDGDIYGVDCGDESTSGDATDTVYCVQF